MIAGSYGNCMFYLVFKEIGKLFLRVAITTVLLMYDPSVSASLTAFSIITIFNFASKNGNVHE
jgi:hypothetical protein